MSKIANQTNSILCAYVVDICRTDLTNVNRKFYLDNNLNKTNTYVVIFAYYQHMELHALITDPNVKILFKSRPCRNDEPGHSMSKNTVVVFELLDSYGKSDTV